MFVFENCLHEIITYILSYFLPTIKKDIYLQKKLEMELMIDEDFDMSYDKFRNELYSS